MDSIFVQIASYRDPELIPTLDDLISKAKHPNNLKICIAHQYSKKDKWDRLTKYKKDSRFIIIDIPYKESLGVCWARNQIQQHYDGEKYTLQLDSHHRFVRGWDVKLIAMMDFIKKIGHQKPLITTYLPSYNPNNDPDDRQTMPWGMSFHKFSPEGVVFFLPYHMSKQIDRPLPARFYSAHFAFTLGKFCKEVPHDPLLYFHGEEISIAARAFTWGYSLFHPHEVIAWHEYTREGRTKHWDDHKQWTEQNTGSLNRMKMLLGVDGAQCSECVKKNLQEYGFGEEATLEDFQRHIGIRFKDRAVQQPTIDNKLPGIYNFPYLTKVRYIIEFNRAELNYDDYSFVAIIFQDAQGKEIYREDVHKDEVDKWYKKHLIQVVREYIGMPAYKYVVYPYSESKGWDEPIIRYLQV